MYVAGEDPFCKIGGKARPEQLPFDRCDIVIARAGYHAADVSKPPSHISRTVDRDTEQASCEPSPVRNADHTAVLVK